MGYKFIKGILRDIKILNKYQNRYSSFCAWHIMFSFSVTNWLLFKIVDRLIQRISHEWGLFLMHWLTSTSLDLLVQSAHHINFSCIHIYSLRICIPRFLSQFAENLILLFHWIELRQQRTTESCEKRGVWWRDEASNFS